MVRFDKQLRKCRRAVSDVIGNLLILAITVTLFSSIMYYVASMPEPQDNTFADISYELSEVSGGVRWIYLTHEGGQPLYNSSTNVYIFTDETNLIYTNLSASVGEEWVAGEVWSYQLTGITEDTSISFMIVDTGNNVIVWQADMVGGGITGSYSPIITIRGTNPSPIIDGRTFTFYVSIVDPNGDLDDTSVYINASSIFPANPIILLTDVDNDGKFVSATRQGDFDFDGKTVMIYASDLDGHDSSSIMTLEAEQDATSGNSESYFGPFNNYSSYFVNGTYPPDASGGESTSKGTTFYYIRDMNDTITNLFEAKEAFYIEVYSNELQNLALDNSFYMYNPTTGGTVSPQTKLINAFEYGGIFATFHRYIINLTAPDQMLTFPIQISLRDNTGTVVNIIDTIKVNGATYPILKTYKLNETSALLEECTTFEHTDVVYLKIFTKDVDLAITAVTLYDLQVNAYTGKYIIKQTPAIPNTYTTNPEPALAVNEPLTQIYKTSSSSLSPDRVFDNNLNSVYTIQIDLLEANQAWWLAGKNSYTMYLPIFTDSGSYGTGETYYNMNLQFNVTAPKTTTDIVASIGSGSFTWSASGASWDDNQIAWFKNGEKFDQWERISIDDDTFDGPVDMCLVDVDNDGYQDVVVGYQDSSVALAWYRNKEVDGSEWSSSPHLISSAFDAYPGLQADMTSHTIAFVARWYGNTDTGTANEDVTAYSTDRSSFISRYESWSGTISNYYSQNEIVGAIENGDFNGDGKQDLVVSFIHSVVYTSANSPGGANYGNTQGMFFNRGVYIFWNDGSWTRTQLSGTDTYTNTNANPAALDLAVGDLNQDGVDDIVAVYETGVTKIWLNQWYNVIGSSSQPKVDAFGAAAVVAASSVPTVTGTNPWDHTQRSPSVVISDVDRNGYPDIIRTSTYISGGLNAVTVIRTMPSTPTTYLEYPSDEYSEESEISAYVQGSIADLAIVGSSYETLTEVYKNTSNILGLPDQKQTSGGYIDNTGQDIEYLKYDEGTAYNVDSLQTMAMRTFAVDSTYSTKPITQVLMRVKFSATATYTGTNYLLYSLDGLTYYSTNILPTSSSVNVNTTYDLYLQGVDTWADLTNLRVAFVNNGLGTVQFDYIRLEIKFAETRWMEWVYEIPNVSTQILHELTMQAYATSTDENFNVYYSTDDNIWYPAFTYNSTTETTYSIMLPHTTNSVYYVKVSAEDSSFSDVTNNSLLINYMAIAHTSPTVYWPSASVSTISFNVGTNEYITCLAVADVGSSATDHQPDQYPDVVVGTTRVGDAYTTQSIMIATGTGSTFDSVVSVSTSKLAANVGTNNAIYNTQSIALGDYNGDGYVDIAITIGFAPGRSGGTAASVWLYRNEPLEGSWQWEEQSLNMLATGESAINVQAGNVDISILFPIFGVLGLVAVEGALVRADRKRKK